MGNSGSLQGPYADIELPAQDPPLVAIDQRFVRPEVTWLRFKETFTSSKNLAYKDVASGSAMFRTGPHNELQTLLDADKQPVVHIATKESVKGIYYVYRPGTSTTTTEDNEDSELLQVYVQLGRITKTGYLDTTLRVNFTDLTTGERCKIEMQGEWCSHMAMLWLERGAQQQRTALAKIYKISKTAMRSDFDVEIAPNADAALVLLVCAVVDDDLKRSRLAENKIDRKRVQPGWAVI